MEIRNLMSFIHVAELNSFTKAAERLGYSQSTISFQIKQLENELGCLLFDRINHSISLTDKGKELLEYAQQVTALTGEFMQKMQRAFLHSLSTLPRLLKSSPSSLVLQRQKTYFSILTPATSLQKDAQCSTIQVSVLQRA